MPSNLPLAIDIADTVSQASEERSSLEVEAKAQELLDQHPEADATPSNVVDALREQ
jgi:hypothetical protein